MGNAINNFLGSKSYSYLMFALVIAGVLFGFAGNVPAMAMCYAFPAGAFAGLHLRKLVDNDYEDLNE